MPLKLKIIHISIYYLMYKHLYNTALNLDVAFVLSVSIYICKHFSEPNKSKCHTIVLKWYQFSFFLTISVSKIASLDFRRLF